MPPASCHQTADPHL